MQSDQDWLAHNLWLPFIVVSFLKFVIQQSSLSIFFGQVFEWFTIFFMIRFESLSAMRTIIYKNYNKNDDMFNINEIKIRRVACALMILMLFISSGQYGVQIYNGMTYDTYKHGDALDYNLKLLSL